MGGSIDQVPRLFLHSNYVFRASWSIGHADVATTHLMPDVYYCWPASTWSVVNVLEVLQPWGPQSSFISELRSQSVFNSHQLPRYMLCSTLPPQARKMSRVPDLRLPGSLVCKGQTSLSTFLSQGIHSVFRHSLAMVSQYCVVCPVLAIVN